MNKLAPVLIASGLVLGGMAMFTFPMVEAVESGMAKGVDPDASALNDGGAVRTLTVGDDVAVGETIETGPTGQVQLLFADQTQLVVGPQSKLRIDDYLIRNDGSAGNVAIAALAGTFRFVTGTSAHDSYKITTPTGTIGVRGTAFDFSVLQKALAQFAPADYVTSVVLYNGAVRLCNLASVCITISDVCGFGAETATEAELIDNTAQSRQVFRSFFPYASDQTPLLREFWVQNSRNCLNFAPSPAEGFTGKGATAGGDPAQPTSTTTVTTTTAPTTTTTPTTTTAPTTTTTPTTTINNTL